MDLNSTINNKEGNEDKIPYIKDIHLMDDNELEYVPLGFFIGIASAHYGVFFQKYLYNLDLNLKQFFIILTIIGGNNITLDKLSSILNINEATLNREINDLEKKNIVTRKIDEKDKRKKIITISEEANGMFDTIKDIDYEGESQLLNYFSKEELNITKYLLKKVILTLEDIVE